MAGVNIMTKLILNRYHVPVESPQLPVSVYSLAVHGGDSPSVLSYLQYVRSIKAGSSEWDRLLLKQIKAEYPKQKGKAAQLLADGIRSLLADEEPGAIVNIPSTRDLNCPYYSAIKERFRNAVDMSPFIKRHYKVKSGEGATFKEVFDDTYLEPCDSLAGIKNILLIDDVYASGNTAAAVLLRLREIGLPDTAQMVIAAPLLVKGSAGL
jgi:adenine/guanine phosphoribosyltransferase-like PRPP-binding protein